MSSISFWLSAPLSANGLSKAGRMMASSASFSSAVLHVHLDALLELLGRGGGGLLRGLDRPDGRLLRRPSSAPPWLVATGRRTTSD